MHEFITGVAYSAINGVINLAVGSIIAIPIYKIGVHIKEKLTTSLPNKIFLILIASFIGMVLPLNIFGLFPIVIALIAAGLPIAVIFPIILSNSLFNLSVPYTEIYFVWQSGGYRIGTALIAGFLGGLLLLRSKAPQKIFSAKYSLASLNEERFLWTKLPQFFNNNLTRAGMFLIVGIILNELLQKYWLVSLFNAMESNSVTAQIPLAFTGLHVMNPIFELTVKIIFMLLNFVTFSGLFVFLRLRGVLFYVGFYLALGVLFGISAFF